MFFFPSAHCAFSKQHAESIAIDVGQCGKKSVVLGGRKQAHKHRLRVLRFLLASNYTAKHFATLIKV